MNRYLVAVLATAAAVVLRLALAEIPGPTSHSCVVLFIGAALASAWFGGVRAGLLSTVLGTLALDFLFIEPRFSLRIERTDDQAALLSLVVTGLVGCWVRATTLADQPPHQSCPGRTPNFWWLGGFVVANLVAAGAGQGLKLIPGVSITFWPPSGIFVAALLLTDRSKWPWWMAGAGVAELIGNALWFHNPLHLAILYFAANAGTAMTAAYLARRAVGGASRVVSLHRLESPQNAALFAVLAGGVAPVVSATIIATADAIIGKHTFRDAWLLVWLGDGTGLLLSAPLTLAAAYAWRHRGRIRAGKTVEFAGTCGLTLLLSWLALWGYLPTVYMVLPVIVWAAVRFQLRGAWAVLTAVILTVAVVTRSGLGEFAGTPDQMRQQVVALQAFLGVCALTALIVAGLSTQHVRALAKLRAANLLLEQRILVRTAALHESEGRYRGILQQSPAGIVQTDATGCMTLVNERWCEMLGYSEAELLGRSVVDVTHPSSVELTKQNVARLAAGGPDFQIEKNCCRKDGSHFPAQSNVSAVRSPTGEFLGLVAVVVDVSERVRADQQLRERAGQIDLLARSAQRLLECHSLTAEVRQEVFGGIAELMGAGSFFHYRADNSERILYLEATGGLSDEDRRVYGTLKYGELLCGRVAESGQRLIVEDLGRTMQPGSESLAAAGVRSYAGFPLLDSRGELVGTLAFISPERTHFREGDVQMIETICAQVALMMERKRAEEALREKEHFLQRITQVTPGVLHVFDLVEMRPVFINRTVESLLAYSPEEVKALGTESALRLMHPEDFARLEPHLARVRVLADGEVADFEHRMRDRAGEWHWFLSHDAVFARDAAGAARQLIGVATEITERKRTEQMLADRTELLNGVLEGTTDVIFAKDLNGRILMVNAAFAAAARSTPEQLVGKTDEDWFPPDVAAAVRQQDEAVIAGESPMQFEDTVPVAGEARSFLTLKAPLRDGSSRIVGILGIGRDITERQQAEEALREHAEILSQVSDTVGMIDNDERILFLNSAGEQLYRVKEADVLGRDLSALYRRRWLKPEDEAVAMATLREHGEAVWELIHITNDGRELFVQSSVSLMRDATGEVTGIIAAIRDITERKRAEEAVVRLAAIVESSHDALFGEDLDGIITSWNRGAEQIFGYRAEEIVGTSIMRLIPEDRQAAEHEVQRQIVAGERGGTFEAIRLTKEGREFPASITIAPLKDAAGKVTGTSRVVRDITERTRAEESLRASQERMRLAAEATGVGIWEWNVITNTIRWDAEMFRIYGNEPTPDGFVHYQDWSGAVLPEDLAENEAILQDTVRRCGQSTREFRIRRRSDGECRWIQAVETVRANHEGKAEWVVGTNLDVTERLITAQALRDVDRRKDEFLATLAHELRNPLAPMRNAIELLRMKGPDIPESQWARDVIDRQTQAMTRLIDDLMDVSRINQGKVTLKREQVELARIVQGAVETSHPLIEQMGHELTVTLPPHPVIVDADLTRLAQVILNLLNNAAKYTERGGRIDLRAELQGSDVVVSVTDTGIGIPADKLPTLFEMFSQVEGALSRSQGGLGIGLCLVKRLVEMHGGSVEARSGGSGQGSEFLVRLPIVVERTYPRPASHDGDMAKSISNLRILVVDDNRDAAESLAMLLTAMGNNVHTVHDGEEGVAEAGKFRPDVVLCDIGLPKLNGYEACRQMKEQAWDKKMILIAVTGWGQDDDRRKSEEAGFDHHLVKPVDPKSLMKLLAELNSVRV